MLHFYCKKTKLIVTETSVIIILIVFELIKSRSFGDFKPLIIRQLQIMKSYIQVINVL